MDNPVEEIKNRLDIVDVIGGYIKLKKAGANHQAVCPFHSEKKPSFIVSPSKQIWKCFGCNKGGDIFSFIMEIEGVEFGDALRILAQRAGVELKKTRPELKTKRKYLYEICELATKFFEKQLHNSRVGKEVKEYLGKRTISEESMNTWRLGYAPDTWHGLSKFLISCGYKKDQIKDTGLIVCNEQGNFYDRFRGRIMFPLFDFNSQPIGFSGRVFQNKESEKDQEKMTAKYVNTTNTMLYDKSKVLYGLDKARVDIRKQDNCILVEGQTDVILSYQAGIKNIAATSGTALTPYQLNILKRYSKNLMLGFDMDVAGDTAVKRGIALAQKMDFNIKVLRMSGSHDAADVIAKNPKDWKEIIQNAQSILDYYFQNALSKFDKSDPEGKQKIAKVLLPVLKRIPNKIVRYHWIQRLAKEIEAREEDIENELAEIKPESHRVDKEIENKEQVELKTKEELIEEQILLFCIQDKKNIQFLSQDDYQWFSKQNIELLEAIKEFDVESKVLKEKLSPDLFQKLQFLSLKAEVESKIEQSEQEIKKSCFRLKSLCIKKKLEEISMQIKKAERNNEKERLSKLVEEFDKLAKQINQLSSTKNAKII